MGGLTIQKAEVAEGGNLIADRRLYQTADGRVVDKADGGAYLLASGAGDMIAPDVVKAMRLEVKDGKIEQAKPDPGAPQPVSDAEKDALAVGLKKAAEEKRKADLGKMQTDIAVTEAPPVDEKSANRARALHEDNDKRAKEESAASPTATPVRVPKVATPKKAARKSGK